MHTTHLSEMMDDTSIYFTCDLWAVVVIEIYLSGILQYSIKNKEIRSKTIFEFKRDWVSQ